ncbi:MAG: hypothetical protein FWG92_08030 [Leptospirales bacterium]|nr:hypothetical protein [Leptospirales bacterium]
MDRIAIVIAAWLTLIVGTGASIWAAVYLRKKDRIFVEKSRIAVGVIEGYSRRRGFWWMTIMFNAGGKSAVSETIAAGRMSPNSHPVGTLVKLRYVAKATSSENIVEDVRVILKDETIPSFKHAIAFLFVFGILCVMAGMLVLTGIVAVR